MRYVLRNEFFGGLLYDTVGKDYYFLDPLAVRLLQDPAVSLSNVELGEYDVNAGETDEILDELQTMGALNQTRVHPNKPIANTLSAPVRIFYEITYQCPEACLHCYTESDKKDENELSLEEKISLIDQMVEIGCFRISIAGGEPLMDRDFFPFIEYALEQGIDVSFSTNGTLITDRVAERLASLDIRTINISLDGWDEESFGSIRGKGRLPYVIRGVKRLRKHYKGKIAAKCTLMRTNIGQLEKIIEFSESVGFDVVKFNCVREAGRAIGRSEQLEPSQEEYIAAMQELAHLYSKWAPRIKMVLPVNPYLDLSEINIDTIDDLGFGCYAGKESFCVTPVGGITPCSSFGRGNYTDGNIRERSLMDAWLNGRSMRTFRGLEGSAECGSCSSYSGCKGGCYLRSFKATGSLNGVDPYCYERKNKNVIESFAMVQLGNPKIAVGRPSRGF